VQFGTTDALERLEEIWDVQPPLGASDLGPVERFLLVLTTLRDRLCPILASYRVKLDSEEATIVAALIDVIGPATTQNPLMVGTLYRVIATYGIERFCKEPSVLVAHKQE
jgi:hypothetical protein